MKNVVLVDSNVLFAQIANSREFDDLLRCYH